MAVSQVRVAQVVDMHGGANKAVKIKSAYISSPTDNTETGTGIVLPTNALVEDVWVRVVTADATETLNVGVSGGSQDAADGYLSGVSLATNASSAIRVGSLASGAITRGGLLLETGASSALPKPDILSGGGEVTYTTSSGTDTAQFIVYVKYLEL